MNKSSILENCAEKRIKIKGRIDLLRLTKSKVIIVDFKIVSTIPPSVKEIDPKTLMQLELYFRILQQIYPRHKISSKILWTKLASLVATPLVKTDDVINSLFINQVLDETEGRF